MSKKQNRVYVSTPGQKVRLLKLIRDAEAIDLPYHTIHKLEELGYVRKQSVDPERREKRRGPQLETVLTERGEGYLEFAEELAI